MKIKCKECKTIYDNSEKYCPYCFNRTDRIVRFKASVDARPESPLMEKREKTPYNYRARKTTKYKNKKNPAVKVITFIFSIYAALVFGFVLLSIFLAIFG